MRAVMLAALVAYAMTETLAMQATSRQVVRTGPDLGLPFSPAVKAGDFIYVSGSLATDGQGRIVPGDITAQTRRVLESISATLEAAGASLDRAASVMVYLKNAGDFAAMNEVYRSFFPKDPPARTTVTGIDFVVEGALIEISMVAIRPGAERTVVAPAGWMAAANPYSYGIKSGDTLFLAGLISRSGKDNTPVPGDTAAQTRTVLENGRAILEAAGMTLADVVSSKVYLTDATKFQEMNGAYRALFPKDPPARATVRTGLTAPQYLVEITMVAVKGGTREVITAPAADGTPGKPNPNLSSAIKLGNRVYVSGMLGNTETNKGDAGGQTQVTLTRIGRTLEAAGFSWADVVDAVVYLTDVKNFAAMNKEYRAVIPKDYPARATIQTGLMGADGLVEIMVTAAR